MASMVELILSVLGASIVIVNAIIVFVVAKFKRFRKNIVYVIIGNLAVADMLVGVSVIGNEFLGYSNLASEHLCMMAMNFLGVSCTVSVSLLALLAFNQYYAITHPLVHKTKFTLKRIWIAIAVVWIFSAVVGTIALIVNIAFTPDESLHGCSVSIAFDKEHLICVSSFYGVLLGFIVFTHVKIILVINKQAKVMEGTAGKDSEKTCRNRERNIKITRKLILVVALFLICWMPFMITAWIWGLCPSCGIREIVFTIVGGIAAINSFMNFVIYSISFKDFKDALYVDLCGCRGNRVNKVDEDSTNTNHTNS